MPEIAVVHLVRHANGLKPFEAFMASYEAHDPGHEHELVLLAKGFSGPGTLAGHRRRAASAVAQELHVPDDGMDLTAYLAAARRLPHSRLCFVNSFSEILADGWLARLSAALDAPGAGVAGATGSWGSHRSFALFLLGLPGPYRKILGDRRAVAPAFRAAAGAAQEVGPLRRLLDAGLGVPREIAGFGGFPAPHVRTNAFLIERERLLSLRASALRTKAAAYRFEGGRRGMTVQLRERGLTPFVVGRDGAPLGPDAWPQADVFWQGDQRDLLVADRQTRAYAEGSSAVREALSRYAWGDRARPG